VSTNKTTKTRKTGEPVRQRPKTKLRLLKPQSECSTTDLITELSREVKVMLRGQQRRRKVRADDDPPEAA
jgi:hypothetical protein